MWRAATAVAQRAIGVVRVAAIPLLNHPRHGLWPWLPLLTQGGEPLVPSFATETN